MAAYALSRAAEDDLARIAAYTVETFGIEQAIAYRDGLKRAFEFLAENPRAARLRAELKPPYVRTAFSRISSFTIYGPMAAS